MSVYMVVIAYAIIHIKLLLLFVYNYIIYEFLILFVVIKNNTYRTCIIGTIYFNHVLYRHIS